MPWLDLEIDVSLYNEVEINRTKKGESRMSSEEGKEYQGGDLRKESDLEKG